MRLNKDRLQNWALVAEVISGIAVVVTLVFLVIEMRGSTNATQAHTYQLLMGELNAYRTLMVEPDLASTVVKAEETGWQSLDVLEQYRLYATGSINWGIYESAYYANKRGVIGESEWKRFELSYCRRMKEQPYLWSQEGLPPMTVLLTPEFVAYLDDLCD